MAQKTVLLIDDDLGFQEPLADALEFEGFRVLKASTGEDALRILAREKVHLATVDIMMPPGKSLEGETSSHQTGILLCETITQDYPSLPLFCLSVVSDHDVICRIESLGVRFIRKRETRLRTVLTMINSRLTGIVYSTDRKRDGRMR